MQDGMILNQITNHVREIILDLRKEYVEVPDFLVQIMDSYARYKRGGVAGLGISIPSLTNRANAIFYNDLDEAQAIDNVTEVARHFAYWKHMYVPVLIRGTVLKQTVGLTVSQLVQQNYSLGHMNKNDGNMLLNLLESEYLTAAAGIQGKKVTAAHGHYMELLPEESDRRPETLDDLFNEDGDYHNISIDALGSWDNDHVWGHRPLSNNGTDAEKKYRNRPVIYDMTSGSGQTFSDLHPILRRLNMVVKTPKLGFMWDDGFSNLVDDMLDKNTRVPQLTLGGAGAEYDIDCVKIAGTTIIADPNTPEDKLRILNVGTPSMQNGTIFPMYYDPMVNPVESFRERAAMLSLNKDRPRGMTFGRPRPTPFHGMEWSRNDRYVDAAYSQLFLDYIPFLCTVRGHQMEIRWS